MRNNPLPLVLVVALMVSAACQRNAVRSAREVVDSLNARSYRMRYTDVDSAEQAARKALWLAGGSGMKAKASSPGDSGDGAATSNYSDGQNEALLNLAFVAYQQMDFDGLDSLLSLVRQGTRKPLLRLCADVLDMKACQRTGAGPQFFRARSRAEKRLRSIAPGASRLSDRDKALWVYAQTEFHIIAATYYFYAEEDSMARRELAEVLPALRLHVDTAQWVYYNYMLGPGGLVEGPDAQDVTLREFDYLFRAYYTARHDSLRYFEANCLQAFAPMMLTSDSLLASQRPDEYQLLRLQHQDTVPLALALARRALGLFQRYDDLFQTACAYRTLGEVYFQLGQYDRSLDSYVQALACVNRHHRRYYARVSPDTLSAFNPRDLERSVEKEWIEDPRVRTVPEWIAGIRQQLSLTFSALDETQASDYNRNFYLDLLQATNQNLELEARTAELRRETRGLRERMAVSVLLLVLALALFGLWRWRLRRQASRSLRRLTDALSFLQQSAEAQAPAPQGPDDDAPHAPATEPQAPAGMPLFYQYFARRSRLALALLRDQRDEQADRLALAARGVARNKRRNAENRAKVSLAEGIVPFLDRIVGEVARMERSGHADEARRQYILELADQIEGLNALLTEWIKLEPGALSLHITTFPLQKLLDIVAQGHYPFDQKGIALRVLPSAALVKADESLTLFMLNTLCDNARKFTPEGGSVTLETREGEDYVEVTVTDTGCGLSEADVETLNNSKLYDAAAIGSPSAAKGFGFGLMNCRGIIEKYRKTSSLFSPCAFGVRSTLGQGSAFWFRLPRVVRAMVVMLTLALPAHAERVTELYDSLFQANVDARYDDALGYARDILAELNHEQPTLPALRLCDTRPLEGEAPDLRWAQAGAPVDYDLLIGLRNEVALAAMALHDWPLYQYNNKVCNRLYRFTHQDPTLPGYYHRLEKTHERSNWLLLLIVVLTAVVAWLAYKLLVRGLVRREREIDRLAAQCQDIVRQARDHATTADYTAATQPLAQGDPLAGQFRQQVMDMAVRPQALLREETSRLADEAARQAYEEARLHVQNQVMDNCLSTIKHELMYYPSRIRLLAERMTDADIPALAELTAYYRKVYALLCRQAEEQARQPGFKRQRVGVGALLRSAQRAAHSLTLRDDALRDATLTIVPGDAEPNDLTAPSPAPRTDGVADVSAPSPAPSPADAPSLAVLADEILAEELLERLLTVMLCPGARLTLSARADGRFVRFTLRDADRRPTDEALAALFLPAQGHVPNLVARQILREHDTYCNHPGLRLAAQPSGPRGYEVYFTLPQAPDLVIQN